MATRVNATLDPAIANEIVAQVEKVSAAIPDSIPDDASLFDLPETQVTLPGGYLSIDDGLITDAEVRELTGEDEEVLSRLTSPGKMLITILERAVTRVGGKKPDRKILDSLLTGDRDTLLLAIRRVTFGNEVTYTTTCDVCSESCEFVIDLSKDIPMRYLEDQSDRVFHVDCKAGTVEVALPNGATQRELMQASEKTIAEINSILLSGCVQEVNGLPSMGLSTVKKLGIMDREKITREIGDRVPGPRFNDVKKECPKCGSEATLQMSLASLFLF